MWLQAKLRNFDTPDTNSFLRWRTLKATTLQRCPEKAVATFQAGGASVAQRFRSHKHIKVYGDSAYKLDELFISPGFIRVTRAPAEKSLRYCTLETLR